MTATAQLLDADSARWSEFLGETRHDFYHLPEYVALCAAQEAGEARALYVEEARGRLLLPLVVRSIPGSDRTDAISPYGYAGPLVHGTDDAAFTASALRAGAAALRAAGMVSLFVRFHPLLNGDPPGGVGQVVHHGDTVSIDLTLPPAMLWGQMRHGHRQDIRNALRHGLVARTDPEFAQYDLFKVLYRATMDRRSAAAYYYFADEYFDGLRVALGDRLHLVVVERDGAVAAAGLFVETAGIVQYHLGGVNDSLPMAGQSKLMMHFAALWAKERGNQRLHLGGGVGGADDSLLHFKAGFSPLRHPFQTLRLVLDREAYASLVRARDPGADPEDLGGYFPAYRTE